MKLGFIGLGKMGLNMSYNLLEHKHKVVVYNRSPSSVKKAVKNGAIGAYTIGELVEHLPKKKIIWLMVPAGNPVDDLIGKLQQYLKKGDIIIDGGNSFFKDSIRRYNALKKKGISFIDVGTSGGIEGARKGACMMVGGDKSAFKKTENLYKDMCVKNGYGFMGKSGSGHFVKMVHNGIEYGMMGAINEGMQTLNQNSKKFGTNLKEVAKVYAHGSIIESRLMSWLYDSFSQKKYLDNISCEVPLGETEKEMKALEKIGEMKILHEARMMRQRSRKGLICGDFIAAMRNQFGGHKVKKK